MNRPIPTATAVILALLFAGAPAAAQSRPAAPTRLRVTTTVPDALILLDGEPVVPVAGVLVVAPGQHTLTAELEDGRYWADVVDVPAGEDREVTLGPALTPEPAAPALDLRVRPAAPRGPPPIDRYPQRRLSRTWGWIGVGTTTALAAGLVYTALRTMALSASYQDQPTQQKRDEGLLLRGTTEYVLLPATVASLGLTVLAFVLSTPTVAEPSID